MRSRKPKQGQVGHCVVPHNRERSAHAGLADPSVRRAIAAEVRKAGAAEAKAVTHLERAIAAMERR
ncbi:MAG: hypothetical protein GX446_00670 [Chthonomonadales bacterium]|nr:hypothetical protein [Chthonomonadales bacterium]